MKGQAGAASFGNGPAVSTECSTWLQLFVVTWKLSGTLSTVPVEITQFP